jgi:predicted GNAT family N-acyltransferase
LYCVAMADDPVIKQQALGVRRRVFVEEQGVDPAIEQDGLDDACRHAVAWCDGKVIGTGRLLPEPAGLRLGRMAVLPAHRRRGVGSMLIACLLAWARENGHRRVYVHAQTHAVGFYARHGFGPVGSSFLEAGIPHIEMELLLTTEGGSATTQAEGIDQ